METKLQLKKISCSNCGAELMYDPGTQMTNCNFCGSKFEIEKATDEELILPDGIIPFIITKEEYHNAVLQWLSDGDYTPDDILTSSVFDQINGVYLPMYFFKGEYHGNWSASSGYDKTVRYSEYSESQKKIVNKTKTVTDWRPSSGQFKGTFSLLGFAGSGQGIKPEIAVYSHDTTFNIEKLKKYDSKYTLGFNLLEFTTREEDVWDIFGKPRGDAIANADIQNRIPGDKYRDLTSDLFYDREEAIKVYVPYWVVYYKYAEKEFHVCMDGTTTSRISGERPVNEKTKSEANKYNWMLTVSGAIAFAWIVWGFVRYFVSLEKSAGMWNFFGETSNYYDNLFVSPWGGGFWWARLGIVILLSVVAKIISQKHQNSVIKASKERRQKVLKNIQDK